MSETTTPTATARKRGRFGLWMLLSIALLALIGVLGVLGLTGRPLPAPDWVVSRIETRANGAIAGQGRVAIGGVELVVDREFVPRVRLRDVDVFTPGGVILAQLPELRLTLKPQPLLRGKVEVRRIRLQDARVILARDASGDFGLDLRMAASGPGLEVGSVAEVLDAVDRTFELPLLRGIERIEAEGLDITLEDRMSGQFWRVSDGRMTLTQDTREVTIALGFDLAGADGAPASAEMSFSSKKGSPEARFGARVANVSASGLAAQSPALAWLGVLDAPISGSFRSGVSEAGAVQKLDATLEIGAGGLRPVEGVASARFDRAKVYFSYDPAVGELEFSDISVDSRALRIRADAKAWVEGADIGLPDVLVGQVRIADLKADPEGLFATPVVFSQGQLDFKLDFDPFALRIGQLALIEGDRRISARGKLGADASGWTTALDFDVNAIAHDQLLALWPVGMVPKTRDWIAQNVTTGELFDVTAALRLLPQEEPRLSLGYEFRGAEVRVLRTLPPVTDGSGYATIEDNAYTLVLDRGHLVAPKGGQVAVAGSILRVPDIRARPQPAVITLRTDSSITGALSLLDEPPFEFLTKAGREVDLAEGRARSETVLNLMLDQKVDPNAVDYTVQAQLSGVTSDRIIPGRIVASDALDLRASREGMTISGPGTLSDVPFRVSWTQAFGADQRGKSQVEGTVELSQRFLDTFGIGLPKGTLGGEGVGQIEIALDNGAAPRFTLVSDLNRLGLSLPQIGWSKARDRTGRLEVTGALGTPPQIDVLSLTAPGLSAKGTVTLGAGGGLELARFGSVDLGWFKGSADLRGRGAGRPVAVAITGGTLDMARAAVGSGGAASAGGPLSVSLDRLRVSEGISLTGFRGDFTTGRGLEGRFQGRVNGEAPVQGTVTPGANGRGVLRIISADAGAVFRAAGIFARARGGAMSLLLDPVGATGNYNGRISITNVRVRDAPVLAELLGAISVVGMLEQLGGEGILFNEVFAGFALSPNAVELRQGRAAGASLGVTMQGVYWFDNSRLDMEGVISPIYIVNAVGQAVSRRGEGLFGFNYRLRGNADDPRVTVNPLSILTPGFLRDIFRRPAATVKDRAEAE